MSIKQEGISFYSITNDFYINRCDDINHTDLHSHNFIEIAYVAEGEGEHIVDNNTISATKGDITIINFDIPHKFVAKGSNLTIYNCIFTPQFSDALLYKSRSFFDLSNNYLIGNFYTSLFTDYLFIHCSSTTNTEIFNIYNKMLNEYKNKKIGYKEIIRGYLIELLILIFRAQEKISNNNDLYPIIEYIYNSYKTRITLEELAKMCGMSVSSFHRKFKKLTNCNLIDFVQRLRVEEACNLLSNTNKTVVQIANEVGYSDIKYFYKVFKKITGNTPKHYKLKG